MTSNKCILIIEPDIQLQNVLGMVMEAAEQTAFFAKNESEALEYLDKIRSPIGLVLHYHQSTFDSPSFDEVIHKCEEKYGFEPQVFNPSTTLIDLQELNAALSKLKAS